MRYKTVFRLVLRAMGVYFTLEGFTNLVSQIGWTMEWIGSGSVYGFMGGLAGSIVQIAIGLYLFFGGTWILNKMIPANRPYCPECAYDLTGAVSERCPECGTPFSWEAVRPGKT